MITLLWRRQSQNVLHDPQIRQHWPVECLNACRLMFLPLHAMHGNTIHNFFSFSLCLFCLILPCPPPPHTFLSLQSMRTLVLQWVWRVPGQAAENNLLLPHLPNKHPRLHQHLPHGPLPQCGQQRHRGRDHCWQWRRFLQDGATAHRWRDVRGKGHRRATGLWPVFGAKVASLRHAQHLPG